MANFNAAEISSPANVPGASTGFVMEPWTSFEFGPAAQPLPVIRVKIWDPDTSQWITPPSS